MSFTLSSAEETSIRGIINTYVIGDFFKAYLNDTSDNVNMAIQLAKERNLISSDNVNSLQAIPNFYLADILKTAIDYVGQLRKYEKLYLTNKSKIDPEIMKIEKSGGVKYTDLDDLKTAPLLKYYRELAAIIKKLGLPV